MKFDYAAGISHNTYIPEYNFTFTLTQDEVYKVIHKYDIDKQTYMEQVFGNPSTDKYYKILASIEIIRDALSFDKVDLGVDYKKKYEELAELLEPHRIDEDMSPTTTLKMLLKYKVNPDTP
jgi:hypothetical protein